MAHTKGEVISVFERKTSQVYKRYTLLLLLAAITALVVCTAVFALRRDAVPAVQGNPRQTLTSHYSPNPAASQENGQAAGISPSPAATPGPSDKSSPLPSPPPSSVPAPQSIYIVTVWAGKIGVFESGESAPVLTAEIDTALLPPEDLSILQKGIRVTSLSEARAILEDYE